MKLIELKILIEFCCFFSLRYNKLDSDELKIIQGALKLKKITVAEIMTKVEDIFSLPAKSVLNFNTLTLIQKSGFSRIPVYEKDRSNIVAVLFAKDLAFVDPDDKIPLQTLCQYYKHEISYVFEDSTCYTAFTLFKEGTSHMVILFDNEIIDNFFLNSILIITFNLGFCCTC